MFPLSSPYSNSDLYHYNTGRRLLSLGSTDSHHTTRDSLLTQQASRMVRVNDKGHLSASYYSRGYFPYMSIHRGNFIAKYSLPVVAEQAIFFITIRPAISLYSDYFTQVVVVSPCPQVQPRRLGGNGKNASNAPQDACYEAFKSYV